MFRVTIIFLLSVLFFHIISPKMYGLSAPSPLIARKQRYAKKRENRTRHKENVQLRSRQSKKNKKNSPILPSSNKNNLNFNLVESGIFSFTIPQNWQYITDKTQLPEKLDGLCIGPGTAALTPTITIACEKTKASQEEYLTGILKYHRKEENTINCSLFTTLQSEAGSFNIIKAEKLTNFGEVALIQAILMRNRSVYIFTGTSLKENINDLSLALIQCVTSFKLNIQSIENQSLDEIILEAFENLQIAEIAAPTKD